MVAIAAKGAAVALVGALVGAAAVWWAYPRVHRHVQDHVTVRTKAILSQAQQGRFGAILIGDSTVELAYEPLLCGEAALDAGIGGARAAEIPALLRAVLADTHARKVLVEVGVNDADRTAPTTPSDFRRSYADIISTAKAANADVTALTIAPVAKTGPLGAEHFDIARIKVFNAVIRDLAPRVIETSGLAGSDGYLPSSSTLDGVHLTPQVYEVWTSQIAQSCSPR